MLVVKDVRKVKAQFLRYAVVPWILLTLIRSMNKNPQVLGDGLIAGIALLVSASLIIFTIRFSLKLDGVLFPDPLLGWGWAIFWAIVSFIYPLVSIFYLLGYRYPRKTGVKLTFWLGDKVENGNKKREHSISNKIKAEIDGDNESKSGNLDASIANIPDNELIERIESIQFSKDKTEIPFLIKCLCHSNIDVKWQAIDALGEIQDIIALKALKPLLSDSDIYVRQHAKKAIDKIVGV